MASFFWSLIVAIAAAPVSPRGSLGKVLDLLRRRFVGRGGIGVLLCSVLEMN